MSFGQVLVNKLAARLISSQSIPFLRTMAVKIDLCAFDREIIKNVKRIIPDINAPHHKGSHGRIGIIGGSEEYTGGPYFAGISALRVGADLVHIFCVKDASTAIKTYSPDLIVHPILDKPDAVEEISKWLEKLHVLVIGPGLGQDPLVMENVNRLLRSEAIKSLKLVIDADGLKLYDELLTIPDVTAVLTPNAMEFKRMFPAGLSLMGMDPRFTVMSKGERDMIYMKELFFEGAQFKGTGRRCGGQGDLLSGAIATLLHWASMVPEGEGHLNSSVVACQGASLLIKLCNYQAVSQKGRGTLAEDMIDEIPLAFFNYFEG